MLRLATTTAIALVVDIIGCKAPTRVDGDSAKSHHSAVYIGLHSLITLRVLSTVVTNCDRSIFIVLAVILIINKINMIVD